MAKVKKVYAIKYGFDNINNVEIRNSIVDNWGECSRLIKGVKGAIYKSFERLEDAQAYLSDESKLLKKGIDKYPMDRLHIYVDGSYNVATEMFSYGLVAVRNEVIEYMENGASCDNSQKQIRQIAGELKATIQAVEYAKLKGEKKIVILHDYEGIYHHALGTWERKDDSSKAYYDIMNKYMKEDGMDIIFVKVDSHTGDIYNEITDNIAKSAIKVTLTDAVDKYLKQNKVMVNSEIEENKLKHITKKGNHFNIININYIETENAKDDKEDIGYNSTYENLNNITTIYKNLGEDKLKSKLKTFKKQELIDLIVEIMK